MSAFVETTRRLAVTSARAGGSALWWVHGLMVMTILFTSSSFPVAELITSAMPADVMMLIRFVMAAGLFAPLVFCRHGFHVPPVRRLLGYALLSMPLATFFWCMFEALKDTTAIKTGALFTTIPAMTALLALLINGERTTVRKSLGLMLGTLGAVWIVFKGELAMALGLELNTGDWIFFAGAVALSVYNTFIRRVYSGEPMEVMTFWVILFGAVWMFMVSLPSLAQVNWQQPVSVYGGLFYLALFTTLLSFFLLQFGTVRIGPTKVASYSFLTPLFVWILSLLWGLAEFNWRLMPGLVLVVVAMVCIQKEQ
ncbi:DMT family transporter [Aestuariicella sp. G3-2]|uniref:DMT family transporter n=1 Tax=Pseudomaricurvus albidus TaxID=2842452 RepID=UPI001C0C71EA|nr:DMT family transporter [Aestuariicella albida]MBU3069032.1 DMT family transporter [Aestuariicella albida]